MVADSETDVVKKRNEARAAMERDEEIERMKKEAAAAQAEKTVEKTRS